jgi:succinate dehydrogenase / fumarate reductase cytochrome b subunit
VHVALRRTARSRTAEFGSLYKGREGQWSWIAHRVTGVAIILFLFAHVVDTALVGWGPDAYNRVVSVYRNPFIRLLELGLVAAVIYHALNGIRIMIIDFWPKANDHNRELIYTTVGLFFLSMIPIGFIIVTPIVERYFFTFPSWWPF